MKFFAVNSRLITIWITLVFNEVNLTTIAPTQGYSNN